MSKQHHFDKARIQYLLTLYLRTGCNFEENFPQELKKPLQLYFHELNPMVQLGDGFTFIEARFSKEAINLFRKQFSHLQFSALRDKLVKVTRWSISLRHVNSADCFNSFENLGAYLNVEEFHPQTHRTAQTKQAQSAVNVFDLDTI